MSERFDHTTVVDIVLADARAAGVFEQFGIDFYCAGRRSLADACRRAATDPAMVIRELEALSPPAVADDDVMHGPVDRLIHHILAVHHAYVRSAVPAIERHLRAIQAVHGAAHPELRRIGEIFGAVSGNLEQHMIKEERILFPYLRELAAGGPLRGVGMSPFGTVENPIRMMEREHREAADEVRLIRELTNRYVRPADGGVAYETCLTELSRFEYDLHRHLHLENNVLFPRVLVLEQRLVGS